MIYPLVELGNFLDVGIGVQNQHNPCLMGRFPLRRGEVSVPALTVQRVL